METHMTQRSRLGEKRTSEKVKRGHEGSKEANVHRMIHISGNIVTKPVTLYIK